MSVIKLNPNESKSFDLRLDDVEANMQALQDDNNSFKDGVNQDNAGFKDEVNGLISPINDSISSINGQLNDMAKKPYKTKQYVKISPSTVNAKIRYKYYNTLDYILELQKCGLNNLFSFSKIYKAESNKDYIFPLSNFDSLTTVQTFDTDVIGPIMVEDVTTTDGDRNIAEFTGGWHGYNGDQTGTATARQVSVDFFVDGRLANDTDFEGYCDTLVIKSFVRIQAFNTRKSNGTGREVLEQYITMIFREGKCEIHIKMVPLVKVRVHTYYGLQIAANNIYANSPLIHFVNGDTYGRKSAVSSGVDSGVKSSFPNVDRICLRNNTQDEVIIWIDRTYSLGTRNGVSATTPGAFYVGYKAYFNLVNGNPLLFDAGTAIEVHGGFAWVRGVQQGGCDLHTKLLRNGLVWHVVDFFGANMEFPVPEYNEYFLRLNKLDEFQRDATVNALANNYYYTYMIQATGYGSYWFRFAS